MLVVSYALLALSWAQAAHAWAGKPPSRSLTPKDAVFQQIVDLRMANYTAAFEYASPSLRSQPGIDNEVLNYMYMIGENYYPLLHTAHWHLKPLEEQDDKARVMSYIVDMEGSYRGIEWRMSRGHEGNFTGCWLTDGFAEDLNPDDLLPAVDLPQRDVVRIVLLFLRQREGEGHEAAYRFFSSESGPRLSFGEFSRVMRMHEEISNYTTVSTIRQLDNVTVESVLLDAENRATTVLWDMVMEPTRNCDDCWLISSLHRLGRTVDEDFSKSAKGAQLDDTMWGAIAAVVRRHPLLQFTIVCVLATVVYLFSEALLILSRKLLKLVKLRATPTTKYMPLYKVGDFGRSDDEDDDGPELEMNPGQEKELSPSA